MAAEIRPHERSHPGPLQYTAIALVLALITAVEVWVAYQEAFRDVLIAVLLVMSAVKFTLVAMFYMHLRFDDRLFTAFFVGGLILAVGVLTALTVLFRVFFA